LGLGAKLNFAFLTVILVMVGAHAAAQYIGEHNSAIQAAHKVVDPAFRQLANETELIQKRNAVLAGRVANDPAFVAAFQSKDRAAIASAVRACINQFGIEGDVVVIDSAAKVLFSTDAPAKPPYPVEDEDVKRLLHLNQAWFGPASLTATGNFSIVGMVPIAKGGSTSGLLAVCQPVNGEFLSGLQKKVEITNGVKDLDFLLFSVKDGKVLAWTPDLNGKDGGFITNLNRTPRQAQKFGIDTENNGRLWKMYKFVASDMRPIALIFATTPFPDGKSQLAAIIGQAAISGFLAMVLAVMFSVSISNKVSKSLQFLVIRAKALAAQKKDLPALDGLSGEFIELAEVIDTAVTSPRSSVKSLQTQMSRHQEDLAEKQRAVEAASSQVEAVNRQLMIQSKQLSEVSKQINHANAQSVFLQQKLASVLAISTEGFLILDAFGNMLSCNPMFCNWAGASEQELAGKFVFDLVRKPDEPPAGNGNPLGGNGQYPAFSHHSGQPGDLLGQFFPEGHVHNHQTGKVANVLLHLQPITMDDQSIQGYVMVLRDKSLHSEANRLRNEIVAMLQESIRAPLLVADQKWSSVLTTTTSTQMGASPLGPALIDLHSNYQAVMGVIDSLLMMHTGIMPVQPVNREQTSITRLIGDCLEQVAHQARAHQIMLDYKTVTGLPSTAIDKEILRDISIQLLEKMISLTAPGGRVRVESTAKNNEIRLSIFSSGPALPPGEIEDMFAGFIQGKHSEDTYSSRLSLYLVRNNLERLGGKIWAESDRGIYFYFTLPIQ
jgi:signal transduction histidine kinase